MEKLDIFSKHIKEMNEPESSCVGLFYRCRVYKYFGKKGQYIERTEMIPLKRMSCSGCLKCGWVEESLQENLDCDAIELDEPIDGAIYIMTTKDEFRDWETGYIDEYTMAFVRVYEDGVD